MCSSFVIDFLVVSVFVLNMCVSCCWLAVDCLLIGVACVCTGCHVFLCDRCIWIGVLLVVY